MERTRTRGIYDDAGSKVVNKEYKGRRIFRRLGKVSQQDAEAWLARQIEEVRRAELFGENPRRTFREGAIKHLAEERSRLIEKYGSTEDGQPHPKAQKQLDALAWHIEMLDAFIGPLPLDEVCDDALQPFVDSRKAEGCSAKTINLTLEKVRRILNKAARKWRENKKPWLGMAPPLITMAKGKKRPPAPLSRIEERELFSRLPKRVGEMCLFKVNTGLRDAEVRGLRWEWERKATDEISVFIIPAGHHKGGDFNRIVVLNSIARSVIEAQRGNDAEWVFVSPRTKNPFAYRLANNGFRTARKGTGLKFVRIHDLKHTFGERLEAAGVPFELKQMLLGHKNGSVTSHYSTPRILELLEAAERVVHVADSVSVVRVIAENGKESRAKVAHPKTKATAKVA